MIDSITNQKRYVYCGGYIPVRLRDVAADVAVRGVRHIDFASIDIERELGQGGFGVVLKGRWEGQWVAVKKLLVDGEEGGCE